MALDRVIAEWHLVDPVARDRGRIDKDTVKAQLTFRRRDSGSRLDRCYVTEDSSDWVVGSSVVVPVGGSDHCGCVTWMRDPRLRPITRPPEPLAYPITARHPDVMERIVGQSIVETLNHASRIKLDWDTTVQHLCDALRVIKRKEKTRANRQRKRRERKLRAKIQTLQDLIAYGVQRAIRLRRVRHGEYLLAKGVDPNVVFKRIAERDQNQTITAIRVPTTSPLSKDESVANKMAAAWQPLLGSSHATVSPLNMTTACAKLYRIPSGRRLDTAEKESLTKTITEDEVHRAVENRGRYKSAGADRLSNDFYIDWADLLVPRLTKEFNTILSGAAPPASFCDAVIVPLRKNGDSDNAMEYRPISLLQSSYKFFTRVLAERVQKSLGKVINQDQNGFVRGRRMEHNIWLMQAVLQQQYHNPNETEEAAPAVILLDLQKAYDTLDRQFVSQALNDFGNGQQFIDLVQRLHTATMAQFLVNGDLSDKFAVRTGIRQGCPLAPLLFLIAVEALKYTLEEDAAIEGLNINGPTRGHKHAFSAFVDDSVVFVRHGHMVKQVVNRLAAFAHVSGLMMQEKKSYAISLNTAVTASHLGPFALVPRGQKVRYLGVEVGLGDLEHPNWEKRLEKIRKRLGIAWRVTVGVSDRVRVLNAVCLPSILFTAQFYKPTTTAM